MFGIVGIPVTEIAMAAQEIGIIFLMVNMVEQRPELRTINIKYK
jgi:hypothetical protein